MASFAFYGSIFKSHDIAAPLYLCLHFLKIFL